MEVQGSTHRIPESSLQLPAIEGKATLPSKEKAPETQSRAGATLWALLTEEERLFFAQQSSIGPLTYSPGDRGAETMLGPVGQRVDRKG